MKRFSATVRSGTSDSSWKTGTMPTATASEGPRKVTVSLP
jgi:hypothetical protein